MPTHRTVTIDPLVEEDDSSLVHAIGDYATHLNAAGRATSTVSCYMKRLGDLANVLGDVSLNSIRDNDLKTAVLSLRRHSRARDRPRSSITMNQVRSIFRSFFRWAFQTGRICRNPADLLLMARTGSMPTSSISAEEVSLFLKTISGSGDPFAFRDEALFATYAFTGLRRTEALTLRVGDYRPVVRTLTLRQKGGAMRVLPVPFALAGRLDRRICEIDYSTGVEFNLPDRPLFPGRQPGRAMSPRQAQNRFNGWRMLAGIRDNLTIHSFRAGFANRLYRTTGDIHLVAKAMGHTDIRSTRLYIENNDLSIRSAIERAFEATTSF